MKHLLTIAAKFLVMSRFKSLLHHWRIEFPQALLLGLSYFAAALLAARYTRLDGGVALLWIATPLLAVDLRYRPERSWTLRMVVCAAASALATSLQGLGAAVALRSPRSMFSRAARWRG